jgi:two-component system chemotaxis response regulator CheB
MQPKSLKVLIADDSETTRMLLVHLLNSAADIQVIGAVSDGQAAVDFLSNNRTSPDVILMDIHMPCLNGFEATRRIMETRPLPIVICTATSDPEELSVAFSSMEAGAVACIRKPVALGTDFEDQTSNLLQTVRLMSEVNVVRRWPRTRIRPAAAPAVAAARPNMGTRVTLVGIGASTGGPLVLQIILSGLPKDFPVPLLIVQHIAQGFLPGMVEWLTHTTGLQVHIATHGTCALPGNAYIAPDDFHLGAAAGGQIILARVEPENGLRPSVSYLFRSLAETCGDSAVGVLLTGMGKDGAAELKQMKDRGAFTIAQDRETSIVHGMPGEAIEMGAASQVLPADRIAAALIARVQQRAPAGEFES